MEEWPEELNVGEGELSAAIKKSFKNKCTAPDPDGITKKVLALAVAELSPYLAKMISLCFRQEVFPQEWKMAKLVLLPKEGKDGTLPSSYWPICLLNEIGKLCERVVADRITQHLTEKGPNLANTQFGFRQGRSTLDAIEQVREIVQTETSIQGHVVLAVSVDIQNAFNSLPWDRIKDALIEHNIPRYLRVLMESYLSDRSVTYIDKTGAEQRVRVDRGVPQGSVSGPLLWNLGFNAVIYSALPPSCHVVSYADDTLVLAGGKDWSEALRRAEIAAQAVINSVHRIGLTIAPSKIEAMYFCEKRTGSPPPDKQHLSVEGVCRRIGVQLRYLGIYLDSHWTFTGHMERVAARAAVRANTLCRLLPRLGGADSRVRRLYAYIIMRAIIMYGAPIWADALASSRRSQGAINVAYRPVVLRTARAYRTTARAATELLAVLPPLVHVAKGYERMYLATKSFREMGMRIPDRTRKRFQMGCNQRVLSA